MNDSLPEIPPSWSNALSAELSKPFFTELAQFVADERKHHTVFPAVEDTFQALELTPLENVRVVVLGQDPYHDEGQAHGLSFSVRDGVKPPPSLRNIFKELAADLGVPQPLSGCLEGWAKQGVLMLNTVLTVRAHEANSHRAKGWEQLTDAIIHAVNAKSSPVVFLLWGGPAQKKMKLIDSARHVVLKSVHPSPLSAHSGFFGSKPFSSINAALRERGLGEINWAKTR